MTTMKNQDLKISFSTVWVLIIGSLLLGTLRILAAAQHGDYSQFLLTIWLMLSFSTWIIVFNDMVKRNIYNKTFWILTMFTLPPLAIIFYMIQRNKLLRLGRKFA